MFRSNGARFFTDNFNARLGAIGVLNNVHFPDCYKECSWKSKMKNVVKYDINLDLLLMVSNYVFVRETHTQIPKSGRLTVRWPDQDCHLLQSHERRQVGSETAQLLLSALFPKGNSV